METKAHHVLIGSFVTLFVFGIFAFLIWLARIEVNREFAYYEIYFRDSVAGLGLGGDVRFNGIKIGRVSNIDIDRQDPSQVRVAIEVARDTPIRSDAFATLAPQGLTGLSFVQITGGASTAPLLEYRPGRKLPVIQSRASTFSQLAESAPELLSKGVTVLDRAGDLLSPDNQRAVAALLAELAATAKNLREFSQRLERVGGETEETLKVTRRTLQRADELLARDIGPLARNMNGLMTEARTTARSFTNAATEIEKLILLNQEPITEFTGEGLAQIGRVVTEARQLIATLSRVAERIENDPTQFLFGGRAPERRAE
ncbi:MAG: MCE family protein [Alphaproteobacteria bacterium]|nr:MCE family protein [Alphaproteobacteria bacterium]